MRIRNLILALICLAASWYYALSLASMGGNGLRPGFANDFGPIWNVSRAILHRVNPYGKEVTEQNQVAEYGTKAENLGEKNDQVFPYPVTAAFPFLPLGLLSWHATDLLIFCIFTSLIALSIGWIRGNWDLTTLLCAILALASYPLVSTLEMRQPTLFFFGMGVAGLALLRSGRLVAAGMLASLAAGKPQVSISLLLPMLIWSVTEWRERRRFVISLFTSSLALFCISLIVVPGWIPNWLAAVRSYSQYVQPSLPVIILGRRAGLAISLLLGCWTMFVLWVQRKGDLLFQVAFCATMFYLITQFVIWNAVLLLLPVLWIADNWKALADRGPASQITLAMVRVSLFALWLGPVLGSLLLHTDDLGVKLAWSIPGAMLFPLFLSLLALMFVQSLSILKASVASEGADATGVVSGRVANA